VALCSYRYGFCLFHLLIGVHVCIYFVCLVRPYHQFQCVSLPVPACCVAAVSNRMQSRRMGLAKFSMFCFIYLSDMSSIACCLLPCAPCGLRGCNNKARSISWSVIVKGAPNQGLVCFVSQGRFFCLSLVFLVYVVFCFLVCTSAIDCLERLVSEMTCCASIETLNPTHSLVLNPSRWLALPCLKLVVFVAEDVSFLKMLCHNFSCIIEHSVKNWSRNKKLSLKNHRVS